MDQAANVIVTFSINRKDFVFLGQYDAANNRWSRSYFCNSMGRELDDLSALIFADAILPWTIKSRSSQNGDFLSQLFGYTPIYPHLNFMHIHLISSELHTNKFN